MNRNTAIVIGVVIASLICLCLCAVAILGASGFFFYQLASSTEFAPILTQAAASDTPTPKPNIIKTPLPTPVPGAGQSLDVLENEQIPESDLRELAMRLKGISDIPETVGNAPANHQVGDVLEFNAINNDATARFTVKARLIYASENVYFFAEQGVNVNTNDVKELVDNFQNKTYPTDREFFGSEWTPGVDGDPHLYILYARGLGDSVGGYFASDDEYSRLANEYSNEKEIFYLNADAYSSISDSYWPGTLAHEFQHMIHWYHDRNETTWMNEGSSELAQLLNNTYGGGNDSFFLSQPDLQLTAWSADADRGAHYGAAFLFMAYFLDRFGEKTTQALVASPSNGMPSVDEVLTAEGLTDPVTGAPITSNDVFADWVVANYLGDTSVGDGRYGYHNYRNAPTVDGPTDSVRDCPGDYSSTVHQFAADYIRLACDGQVTVKFVGSQQVTVIPAEIENGRYAFWGSREDESDITLTREFDLTSVKSATLEYRTWYAIEKGWDYAYVLASTNGGQSWDILQTPSGTADDPVGSNYGWGYTGASGGGDPEHNDPSQWINESVDLSKYAGQKVLIRFEYVTDAALNYAGFMVDDIRIPEINYSTNFETDEGGWDGQGLARIDNLLPQKFVVQVIHKGSQTTVERLTLDDTNEGELKLNIRSGEEVIVVVSGITAFTNEVASYQLEVK